MQRLAPVGFRRTLGLLNSQSQLTFQKPQLLHQKRTFFSDQKGHISIKEFERRLSEFYKANPKTVWGFFSVVIGYALYREFKQPTVTDKVYLDIAVDGRPAGRVVVGLYGKDVPKTAENFKQLATGANGFGYAGTPIFHAVRDFAVFGGDIVRGNGSSGYSIYGPNFKCESLLVRHTRGSIAMVLDDKEQVDSRFFFCLMRSPSFKDHSVAFGEVLEGLEILDRIATQVDDKGMPRRSTIIKASGVLPLEGVEEQALAAKSGLETKLS